MELKNKNKIFPKPNGGLRRIPLPFKMRKYKESDLFKHRIILKEKKEEKISKHIDKLSEKENESENKNIILRANKEHQIKKVEIITKKKYKDIPIIPHNSEKPSIVQEEIGAGKLYPSKYSFNKNKEYEQLKVVEKISKSKYKILDNNFKKKKYNYIPIIEHYSEKPNITLEEINSGKIYSNIQTSITNYKNDKNLQDNYEINKFRAGKNKIPDKKYKDIPIIPHDSPKPTIVIEEINSGKYYSTIPISIKRQNIQINNKLKNKNNKIKNKKYIDIPIISHDSEKPSNVFEEIDFGKSYSKIQTSITEYKEEKQQKILYKNFKNKKYIEIPIIAHDSEKSSSVFEEIDFGKSYSNIQTSITEYKEEKQHKIPLKINKNIKNKKYIEIPINSHDSEKPSIVFEEIDWGKSCSNIQTSRTEYKDKNKSNLAQKTNNLKIKKKNFKNKKYIEIPIIAHDSEKPSIVFEEINVGK